MTAAACLFGAAVAIAGWVVYLACVAWPFLERSCPLIGVGVLAGAVGFGMGKGVR